MTISSIYKSRHPYNFHQRISRFCLPYRKKNMRSILTSLAVVFLAIPAFSQRSEETEIKNIIAQLFEGMEKSDSAMVSAAFDPTTSMATLYRNKNNEPSFHREASIAEFLSAVASPKKEKWHEEFWNVKVNVDGDLASAWCDYAFYVGKTFSHCGVDAFLLRKTAAGWKIFYIADTRRKEPCAIPDEIKKKYQ